MSLAPTDYNFGPEDAPSGPYAFAKSITCA
eukprot:COSAG01_NODE_23677_length_805_cov_101.539660_1_plen_29_part_01